MSKIERFYKRHIQGLLPVLNDRNEAAMTRDCFVQLYLVALTLTLAVSFKEILTTALFIAVTLHASLLIPAFVKARKYPHPKWLFKGKTPTDIYLTVYFILLALTILSFVLLPLVTSTFGVLPPVVVGLWAGLGVLVFLVLTVVSLGIYIKRIAGKCVSGVKKRLDR